MGDHIKILYRGRSILIPSKIYNEFAICKGRQVNQADIDQYIYNESKKISDDMEIISNSMSVDQIQKIVADYLQFEIYLRS